MYPCITEGNPRRQVLRHLKAFLFLYNSTCQTLGTGGVTILRVSVGWWCSGVHVRL